MDQEVDGEDAMRASGASDSHFTKQIGNLCLFLLQTRAVDVVAMTLKELLRFTPYTQSCDVSRNAENARRV